MKVETILKLTLIIFGILLQIITTAIRQKNRVKKIIKNKQLILEWSLISISLATVIGFLSIKKEDQSSIWGQMLMLISFLSLFIIWNFEAFSWITKLISSLIVKNILKRERKLAILNEVKNQIKTENANVKKAQEKIKNESETKGRNELEKQNENKLKDNSEKIDESKNKTIDKID